MTWREFACAVRMRRNNWKYHTLLLITMHEAIFLATCNATMTNKKPFKLQRGCHTFATFLATCNAYNNRQTRWMAHLEISREQKISSDWPILTKLRCKLVGGCYTQATCLATLRKVEGCSTLIVKAMLHEAIFLATRQKNSRVTPHVATAIVALRVARKVERPLLFATLRDKLLACNIPSATCNAILSEWVNQSSSFTSAILFVIVRVASCEKKL